MLTKNLAFNLETYQPKIDFGNNFGQLIVHPDCDKKQSARQGIEALAEKIPGQKSLIIPWTLDFQNSPGTPEQLGLELTHMQVLQTHTTPSRLDEFIQNTAEISLSGGYFGVCHFAYFKRALYTKIQQQASAIFHFLLPCIYSSDTVIERKTPLSNSYFKLLENPYKFFTRDLPSKTAEFHASHWPKHEGIPTALFADGDLLWSNTDTPQIILNYWTDFYNALY